MKRTLNVLSVFFITLHGLQAQNVGINATGAAPAPSAILDLSTSSGNEKGFLVPRMAATDISSITAPATGLMVFNTDCSVFDYWTGTAWVAFPATTDMPSAVNAVASPNPICTGNTVDFTGTATNATSWNWTGPNGFTSTLQNPTLAVTTTLQTGTYTLTASNLCGSNTSTVSVTVDTTIHGSKTFSYTGSMQTFTVPGSCISSITIDARGAQGGNNTIAGILGGEGARMVGTFAVTSGEQLNILVGGMGGNAQGAGGGGGTFVVDNSNNPWVVAGGGGGASGSGGTTGSPGLTSPSGGNSNGVGEGTGGSNEAGGGGSYDNGACYSAGGGGGFCGNGGNAANGTGPAGAGGATLCANGNNGSGTSVCTTSGGSSFTSGGAAGVGCSNGGCGASNISGGYGGGGGTTGGGGGGGGGYSGGGGGGYSSGSNIGGGGGGSFNGGSSQSNTSGYQTGNGEVIITW